MNFDAKLYKQVDDKRSEKKALNINYIPKVMTLPVYFRKGFEL